MFICEDYTCKNYISCSNPKAMEIAFCPGNQGDGNFRFGLQKYVITGALLNAD